MAPVPENRWGVFLTGLGEFTNVDSTSNAPGYDVDTGGFTLGVDYRLTPNFAVGLFGGYAHINVNLVGGATSMSMVEKSAFTRRSLVRVSTWTPP